MYETRPKRREYTPMSEEEKRDVRAYAEELCSASAG
jgi:hypothetical protein